jgi:hypothetical protein
LMGTTRKTGNWMTKVVRVRVKPEVEAEYDHHFLFIPNPCAYIFLFRTRPSLTSYLETCVFYPGL